MSTTTTAVDGAKRLRVLSSVLLVLAGAILLAACQGVADSRTVRRAIENDPSLQVVATVVASTGVTDQLADAGAVTVFMPSRDALSTAVAQLTQPSTVGTGIAITTLVSSRVVQDVDGLITLETTASSPPVASSVTITDLVAYHVVPGEYTIQDLANLRGLSIPSITGQDIQVQITGTTAIPTSTGLLTLRGRGVTVNDSQILTGDISLGNGVVHIVQDVLFPPGSADTGPRPILATSAMSLPVVTTFDQPAMQMVQQQAFPIQQAPIPLSLSVAPNVTGLKSGQSVAISVVSPGWEKADFLWNPSPPQVGSLSSITGTTVIYEASNEGPGPVTITVTGTQEMATGSARVRLYVLGSEEPPSPDQVGLARLAGTTISFTCCDPRSRKASCEEICAIDIGDRQEVQLTQNLVTDFYSSPSPDGESIFYSSQGDTFQIVAVDAESALQVQAPVEIPGHWLYAPDVSAAGDLVFAAQNAESGLQSIWVMERGARPRQLTDGDSSAIDPVWSPDATQIYFASNRDGEVAYYVMDRTGSNVERLAFPKGASLRSLAGRTDISPDGRWLVFAAGDQKSQRSPGTCTITEIGNREVYLLATDGSQLRQVTDGGDNLFPSFSPDGRWVTFTSYRDGDSEIYIARVDGSDTRQLTFNDRCDSQPRWQSGLP